MPLMDGIFGDGSAINGDVSATAGLPQTSGYDMAGSALGALGRSLMTSPSNNPLKNFGSAVQQANTQMGAGRTQAIITALKAKGYTDQQAAMLASNPSLLAQILGQPSAPTTMPTFSGGGLMGSIGTGSPAAVGGGDTPNLSAATSDGTIF